MVEAGTDHNDDSSPGNRTVKSSNAFRTISEVADELSVAQHVLRFWESKFPQVRPLKRGGGRRYYRPEDVEVLKQIRTLLYDEGYTIKGAQRHLRGRRGKAVEVDEAGLNETTRTVRQRPARPLPARDDDNDDWRIRLSEIRDELADALNLLEEARAGQA